MAEWRFFLTGLAPGAAVEPQRNPASEWLPERAWDELSNLGQLSAFEGLDKAVEESLDDFQHIYDASDPGSMPIPAPFDVLNRFQNMLVLRALRPDKVVMQVRGHLS